MRLLFITIAWPAPGERNLYSDLMEEFADRGVEVTVLATMPERETDGAVMAGEWRKGGLLKAFTMRKERVLLTVEMGIRVLRVSVPPIRKVSPWQKGFSLLFLAGRMERAARNYLADARVDLIMAPTPPVTLSPLYRKLKKRSGASFYLLLKDIWPQGSVDLGVLHKYGIPWWILRYHEKMTYRIADHIGCMSPRGVDYFLAHNRKIDPAKVEVCPNSIRPVPVASGETAATFVRLKYGIPEKACLFIFSGNLGAGHGLEFLTRAIRELSDFEGAFFLIGGSGTGFEKIKRELDGGRVRNALLYSWLPPEDFRCLLEAADVGLILLHKYTVPQFPSRLLSYLDRGKAVLCAVNSFTDIGDIVEKEGCGLSVPHGDMARFAGAIRYLSQNKEIRRQMGRKGRRLLLERYTVSQSFEMIMRHYRGRQKLTILLLDQARQALPFLRALHNSGHEVVAACHSRVNEVWFSRYPAQKILWPSYMDHRDDFERKLLEYVSHHRVDVVLNVSDYSSEIVSRLREELEVHTRTAVPGYSTFSGATDKLRLMEYCMEQGIPCPVTYDLTRGNLGSVVASLDFPVIVKPRRGVGAVGVARMASREALEGSLEQMETRFGPLLVQEYIPVEGGMQYQAEAFLDDEGVMKVCLVIQKPRFFPVRGGTSTANVTITHPGIRETTRRLLEGLRWRGAADVDYILDPRSGVVKVLEINPRVTAGIKIGFAAGIDFSSLHLNLALGNPIPAIPSYTTGIYCRNIFLEILWWLFSDRKMKQMTSPPFFPLWGKSLTDQVFSWDDPLTGVGFFLNMAGKYFHFSRLREKLGRVKYAPQKNALTSAFPGTEVASQLTVNKAV